MSNTFDYRQHRSSYVEEDDDLKLNAKMFSMAAGNGFMDTITSPRGLMYSGQSSQPAIICNPTEETIQTGVETEQRKYTVAKVVESDSEVVTVIKRYNILGEPDKAVSKLIVLRNLESGEIDIIDIPYHNAFHPYFGFKYKPSEELDTLVRGDFISKDTQLATPPTVLPDGGYGVGVDVNVCSMLLPEVDEDGFVMSDECCEKYKFNIFDTRVIEGGEDSFFLNIYGDEDNYKPFPEIGEYVNDTGVVAVTRKYDPLYAPSLYSKKDTMDFNPLFDNAVYTRGGKGKIVDIKVFYNPRKKKALPTGTDKQLFKYSEALLSYYRTVVETYDGLNNDYKRMFNKDIPVSNAFNRLLVEAFGVLDSSFYGTKCKKMYRKETLDLFRVEFTIEYTLTPGVRNKFSDKSGGKGVVVEVWPKENMPKDKHGNYADIIVDPKSTISRLNIGRLYERTMKSSMGVVERLIRQQYEKYDVSEPYELSDTQLSNMFLYAKKFIDIVGGDLAKFYDDVYHNKDREAMLSVIEEVIYDRFRAIVTVDNDKRKHEIAIDLEESEFAPVYDKVTYVYNGESKTSVRNIMIAPMYIFMLSKIGDSVLACSSAKLNHFGMPVVTSKTDRYSLPSKNSPVRTQGETEGRIYAMYGGREFLAEIKDLNTSIDSHNIVYDKILASPKPTDIPIAVNRKKVPYGGERGSAILQSLWNSVAMEIGYVDEDNIEYPYTGTETEFITDVTKINDLDEIGLTGDKDDD